MRDLLDTTTIVLWIALDIGLAMSVGITIAVAYYSRQSHVQAEPSPSQATRRHKSAGGAH